MPSIGKIISGHNKKILAVTEPTPPCNCTIKDCKVNGECQRSEIVYQCKVTENVGGNSKSYVGLTANTFKNRYYKHKKSFKTQGYHKNTLSSHIWDLKLRRIEFELSWRIVAKARSHFPSSKICLLCIKEVYFIMFDKNLSSLNTRQEFFNQCLHKDKLKNQ